MLNEEMIAAITEEVIRQLLSSGRVVIPDAAKDLSASAGPSDGRFSSTASLPMHALGETSLEDPADPEALERMKKRTTARIGVGRCGPRLGTQTFLKLRADHAGARDSVFKDVDADLIRRLGLETVESMAGDKNTYLTRPDLGRKLSPEAEDFLKQRCAHNVDVQIYAADGLSSTALEANLERILPVLMDGLTSKGVSVGTPFYMRYGRVGAEDAVAELIGAKVVCVLLGERPGLATAESMSAYIVYNAHVGIPESKRTVVSNIHKNGLTAVEAGAYIVEVIQMILDQKASGVDLVK